MSAMKNLKTPKLYLQVHQEIKNYIVENGLKPGDKLPTEKEMCEHLGVSRNVLREAIKSLEITGLLRSTPGIGSVIQEYSPGRLFDNLIYNISVDGTDTTDQFRRIRRVLELGFAREAFDSMTPECLDKLKKHLHSMEQTAEKQLHNKGEHTIFGSRFAEADAAFHRTLYSGLDLPLLTALSDAFWAYDRNYKEPTLPDYLLFTVEKHRRIYQALEMKDFAKFRNALEMHYQIVLRKGESGGGEELLYTDLAKK